MSDVTQKAHLTTGYYGKTRIRHIKIFLPTARREKICVIPACHSKTKRSTTRRAGRCGIKKSAE